MADPVYLVVNCAEYRLQVLIGGGGRLAWQEIFHAPGRAMPLLAPSIRRGLSHLGLSPEDLSGIAYVRGPGSFTGLRMSIAHLLGLAQATSAPVAGLDYLPVLAAGVCPLLHAPLWCVIHSRRNQVYAQKFVPPDGTPVNKAGVLSPGYLRQELGKNGKCFLLGSGVARNPELVPAKQDVNILPPCFNNPCADVLLHYAENSSYSHNFDPPLYLRPSDAEENLDSIARKRGVDTDLARRQIENQL